MIGNIYAIALVASAQVSAVKADDHEKIVITDTLEFPPAIRPAFDGYQHCLQSSFTKWVDLKFSKRVIVSSINFDATATSIIKGCKRVRRKMFLQAQNAMSADPIPSPDQHTAKINNTFGGLEASFRKFVIDTGIEYESLSQKQMKNNAPNK